MINMKSRFFCLQYTFQHTFCQQAVQSDVQSGSRFVFRVTPWSYALSIWHTTRFPQALGISIVSFENPRYLTHQTQPSNDSSRALRFGDMLFFAIRWLATHLPTGYPPAVL